MTIIITALASTVRCCKQEQMLRHYTKTGSVFNQLHLTEN